MRGPADDTAAGNIWVISIDGGNAKALTADGGYRSPQFSPADGSVVAMKGDTIVRIPADGGRAASTHRVAGITKLVGFDSSSRDDLLVLLDGGASPLGMVSLATGTVTPLPYNAGSDDERRMLAQIRGQDRVYGSTMLYTKTETKHGLSRDIEWTDVYVRRGNAEPRNITACDGSNCVQPALSPDGRRVAYVKVE
jgi:hypothetical protein